MIIGTCSLCGGPVETPEAWMGTLPAPATCKNCGAVRPQHGPVIDMQRNGPARHPVPTESLDGLIGSPSDASKETKPATTGDPYPWAYAVPRVYTHHNYVDPWWSRCRDAWMRKCQGGAQ